MEALSPTSRLVLRGEKSAQAAQLEAAVLASQKRWWRLYSQEGCLAVPDKRRAMLAVRLEYQEAKLNWLFSLRSYDESVGEMAAPG